MRILKAKRKAVNGIHHGNRWNHGAILQVTLLNDSELGWTECVNPKKQRLPSFQGQEEIPQEERVFTSGTCTDVAETPLSNILDVFEEIDTRHRPLSSLGPYDLQQNTKLPLFPFKESKMVFFDIVALHRNVSFKPMSRTRTQHCWHTNKIKKVGFIVHSVM